jgi:hypothetical protein
MHGLPAQFSSSIIEKGSSSTIVQLLQTCSMLLQMILRWPSNLTSKYMTSIHVNHSIWTIETNSIYLCYHKCFEAPQPPSLLGHLLHGQQLSLLQVQLNVLLFHVVTGVMGCARLILALIGANMGSAIFVVKDIEPKITNSASLLSKLKSE